MDSLNKSSNKEYSKIRWDENTIARFWEWQSRHPEQYFTNHFGKQIASKLVKWIKPGMQVLDYGCGMGFMCKHLAGLNVQVSAADFSNAAVTATNERNRNVPGFQGAMKIDDVLKHRKKFDAVVSIEVIEHLWDDATNYFFKALFDLLKPGGIAVITTPNDEDLAAAEVYCPCCDHVFHRWQHMQSFNADTLSAICRQAGFNVITTYTTDFSVSILRAPLWYFKRIIKKISGRQLNDPHLVCVISLPNV